MAISEKICWRVLEGAKDRTVSIGCSSPREKPQGPPIENATGIAELKKNLAMHYCKQDIEDSLCFLEKRGYLDVPRMAFSLTEKAIGALETGSFSEEEEKAFSEALIHLKKTSWMGIKFNVREAIRRLNKWRRKKNNN